MKKLLLIPFIFVYFTVSAQVSFVGKTKAKIKDYWSTRVSKDYMQEGTYTVGEPLEYFMICSACDQSSYISMNPEFVADFIDGICISNSYGIESKNLSVYISRINKAGYKWSEEKQGWIDSANKQIWKIEGSSQTGHTITISLLTPIKSKSPKATPVLSQSKKLGFSNTDCIDSLVKQGISLSDIKGEHITSEVDKITYKSDLVETSYYFRNDKCYQVQYIYDNKDAAMKFMNQLKTDKTLKQSASAYGIWDSITENITYLFSDEEPGKFIFRLTKQNKSL